MCFHKKKAERKRKIGLKDKVLFAVESGKKLLAHTFTKRN